MNEKGVIFPYTALFVFFLFGLVLSIVEMYTTETNMYQQMKEIELLQSLQKMTLLIVEREDLLESVQTETSFIFNKGEVRMVVKDKNEEKVIVVFNCTTKDGATYSWKLWYDRTNKKWNNP